MERKIKNNRKSNANGEGKIIRMAKSEIIGWKRNKAIRKAIGKVRKEKKVREKINH